VELARVDGGTFGVRDSKDPGGGYLTLEAATFTVLVRNIKAGSLEVR
jgi:hypothetical protein